MTNPHQAAVAEALKFADRLAELERVVARLQARVEKLEKRRK